MRGDLNDQLQRAQGVSDDNTTQKIIIIVAAVVAFCFIAAVIAGVTFFVKTLDKFVDTDSSYTTDEYGFSSDESTTVAAGEFEYGIIEGTTYYSSFSGVKFVAPSDWIFTSYATARPSRSPKDMSASGNGLGCSVVIQYESIKTNKYITVTDALESTNKLIDSYGYTIVDNDASAKWGGNMFTGIIYVDTFNNYKEVLVAEVNGYVLKITLSATSDTNLSIVRSYFN